jgi:hypothetical protein
VPTWELIGEFDGQIAADGKSKSVSIVTVTKDVTSPQIPP